MFSILECRESCRSYFKQQKVLILSVVYILTTIKYSDANKAKFASSHRYHIYATREGSQLQIPYHRLDATSEFVDFWGAKLYNRQRQSPGSKEQGI